MGDECGGENNGVSGIGEWVRGAGASGACVVGGSDATIARAFSISSGLISDMSRIDCCVLGAGGGDTTGRRMIGNVTNVLFCSQK